MRIPLKSRRTSREGVTGSARIGHRPGTLLKRLRPGDIAVIDVLDLDQTSAESLIGAGVVGVLNQSPSCSGRYPNLGPRILNEAGVVLVDVPAGQLSRLRDGDRLTIDGATVWRGEQELCTGTLLDADVVGEAYEAAHAGMSSQLQAFAANAQEFIRRENALLLDGVGVPEVRTPISDRHVVVVMRAYEYAAELKRLRTYVKETDPVLVGVGAGADVLLEAGRKPDLVIGGNDELSDQALTCGAEVVLHHPRGADPTAEERLSRLGVHPVDFPSSGTDEDAALLLVQKAGAELVVAVGSHTSLVEFLDRGRSSMASSLLTRLRLGPTLVSADSVGRLYRSRVRTWQLLLLALIGLIAVAAAIAATPIGEPWWHEVRDQIVQWWNELVGWVT